MTDSDLLQRDLYIQTLINAYLDLPETPTRARQLDRELAHQLYNRAIPLSTVQAAFLLATARRLTRPADAPRLQPIPSLYYFLPVIEEVLERPLSETYLAYLRHKINTRSISNPSSCQQDKS